ncbi:hypothetical protein [Thermomonospora cellulosilytica]|uniref:Uncharacterized protein n=1 Tax=Thermomonospora cellulosilytica TaxID=1411118 RepID=A0A7W3MZZ4_9ACTN|nr:hypothetical protein [Thermomonospora cellulosilytica]MBA9004989.1 hypothetical protein [Thermomonospora cellulosilytica]
MAVFVCAGCEAVLTAPVSRVELPDAARQKYGHDLLPVLMEPGTYAVDPHPVGPPWLRWEEIGEEGALARGWYAECYSVPDGPRGAVVIAPGDVRGTVLVPEWDDGFCCGLVGMNGPNTACERCGRAVATWVDDCGHWQAVWLEPQAVRRVDAGPERPVASWEELLEEPPGIPPIEASGRWNPRWEVSAAVSLAHLLAASGGARMTLPENRLLAVTFGRALEMLLPPGPPTKTLALAGPGPPDAHADIVMVPRHPQTGEVWTCDAEAVVPLAAEVWFPLAFRRERRPVPGAGALGVDFEEEPPLLPHGPFRPHGPAFLGALARLPAVREPWLRAIYDRYYPRNPFSPPF